MPNTIPDWYLREWAERLGKRQSDLVKDLGWLKPRASKVWNGSIPYRRDLVAEVAQWLGIKPYELLMAPSEAQALRRLRESAHAIVGEDGVEYDAELPEPPRATRRRG